MKPIFLSSSLILFWLILCNSLEVTAQNSFKINIPESKTTDNRTNRLFYIDSVYATFPDTASIGTVYRSMTGIFAPAYIKDGVSKGFFSSLITFYPQFLPTQKPVVLRIEHLSYTEDFAQGVDLAMHLTFLMRDSAGTVSPIYTARLETDFTGFVGRGVRIQNEMNRAFTALNEYLLDPKKPVFINDFQRNMIKAAQEMHLDSAHYSGALTSEDDVSTTTQKRQGLYLTFNDLIKNRPTFTGVISFEQRDDVLFLRRSAQRYARYPFVGFSDGQNIYINSNQYGGIRGRYVQVQHVGHYLLWRDDYLTRQEHQKNQALGVGFGLAGAILSAATNKYKDCIAIDPKTGSLFHVDADKLRDLLKYHPELLAEYNASDHPKRNDTIWTFLVRYNQTPHSQEK